MNNQENQVINDTELRANIANAVIVNCAKNLTGNECAHLMADAYEFIKNGTPVDSEDEPTGAVVRRNLKDGVYIVFQDGSFLSPNGIGDMSDTHPEAANIVGVGIKQGDRRLLVALHDCAGGKDITLTTKADETNETDRYIDTYLDAVADWDGKGNTEHLRRIGLNPEIDLEPGWWVPSVGEMYLIYTNRRAINKALEQIGGDPLPGDWYLTSTETSAADAWNLYLNDGTLNHWNTKASDKGRVRPVSAFITK